jgi:hypothetical protein
VSFSMLPLILQSLVICLFFIVYGYQFWYISLIHCKWRFVS